MRHLRKFFLIAALVAANMLLAAGNASADGADPKKCVYEMGSQGVCQEFCWTSCHLCDCGGVCEDRCEPT